MPDVLGKLNIFSIFQILKLRFEDLQQLTQGHIVSTFLDGDLCLMNGLLTSCSMHLPFTILTSKDVFCFVLFFSILKVHHFWFFF